MTPIDDQIGLFGDPAAVEPAELDNADVATASQLPPRIRLGTSSWSFPGWEGLVWRQSAARPISEAQLSRKGLVAYAAHPLLGAVGVDRSYYSPLTDKDCNAYAREVPEDFRFVMKADRALVFPPEAASSRHISASTSKFLDASHAEHRVIAPAVAGFGFKLGVVVFQFPPLGPVWIERQGGPAAFADRLHDFLASLPVGPEYAVEIRDRSLLTDAYADALRNAGVSHCFAIHPTMPDIQQQADAVDSHAQRVLLVRWMLNPHAGLSYRDAKSRYEPFNRLVHPDLAARQAIADLLVTAGSRLGYAIINNKAEGSAPLSVQALARAIARV
jgi:uncharacterized protein YecE (DUF72 family)